MKHKPEAIIAAAVALFDEEGVGVSTARVAKAAGVSNGTLFNYFPSKQDLIDGIYLEIKLDLASTIGEIDPELSFRDQGSQIWTRWLTWARADRARHRVASLLHQSGLVSEGAVMQMAAAFSAPQRVLDDARAAGELVDLPLEYIAAIIQLHIELAAEAELDTTQAETAFESLFASIARVPQPTGDPS